MPPLVITKPATVNIVSGGQHDCTNDDGWFASIVGVCDPLSSALIPSIIGVLEDDNNVKVYQESSIPQTYEIEYGFNQSEDIFELDGDPAIDFNALPSGFVITALQFKIYNTPSMEVDSMVIMLKDFVVPQVGPHEFGWYPYIVADVLTSCFSGNPITATQFLTLVTNIVVESLATPTLGNEAFSVWSMTGTYEIQASVTFTLEQPDAPVEPGTVIEVTPSGDDPLIPEDIETVTLILPDATEIVVPEANWSIVNGVFFFIVPSWGLLTPGTITIEITSTQFSGSVTLGTLITIYFISGSGTYKLVPNKRYDTVYNEADLPETMDTNIPTPFGKTGYVGG